MKVTAKATRSGDWWAVEVPEVPGAFTQAKRLDQVADAAAGAVADLLEVDVADVEVELDAALGADIMVVVKDAREAAETARIVQAKASNSMRDAVSILRNVAELTTRDAAILLGISHQRVAQLADSSSNEPEASQAVVIDVPRVKSPAIKSAKVKHRTAVNQVKAYRKAAAGSAKSGRVVASSPKRSAASKS